MTLNTLLPEGFVYKPRFLSAKEEGALMKDFQSLPLKPFEFHGFFGKRRVAYFGFRYDFTIGRLERIEPMPVFLHPFRGRAAQLFGLSAEDVVHAMVTEYEPGAAIGWHRDRAVFDEVAGISLGSACSFRFRRKVGTKWARASLELEPLSAYLLSGPSRTEWQHSIPAVPGLRYSITFRTLRASKWPKAR
jgi:alkylated DNA repair dioxygenase AlkB